MEQEIITVEQADMLSAINRAEVDIQISTAKQYPRELDRRFRFSPWQKAMTKHRHDTIHEE